MQKRFSRLSAWLILLSAFLTFVVIHVGFYYANYEELKRELTGEAAVLAETLNANPQTDLELVGSVYRQHRLTWIDAAGNVLYDSSIKAGDLENHGDREEVMKALESGQAEALRFSDTLQQTTWYYSVRLEDGSVLRVAATMRGLLSGMWASLPLTAALLLAILIFSLWVVSKATKRFIAPINAIDLENPGGTETYDELAPLVTTINQQNRTIREQIHQLQEKQEEFSAITDNMQEGLLVVDGGETVLSYNKSALHLLDVKVSAGAAGVNVFAFNRSEAFRRVFEKALHGEAGECVIQENGRYLQLNVSPVKRDDEPGGVVVLVVDITEKHNREKLRREFTANVSHELKTPLTSISGYAEIMMNGIAKPADMTVFSGKIYQEAARMITLINDTIFLSKLDESEQGSYYETVDLEALCKNAVERLQAVAKGNGVSIRTRLEPIRCSGIRSVLEEMVYNLVDNAIKYNRPGGKVTVTLRQKGDTITLAVADTGIGIPQKEQSRVFERFYRVEKGREETKGTGLGLSIVKHAALMHGGEVEVRSEENKGTTMTVRLKADGR